MFHELDHVAVAVRDLDAAVARTAALLGREPSWRGVHGRAGGACALFRLERTALLLSTPRTQATAARLAGAGEGMAALAFATRDLAAARRALRARGVEVAAPVEEEARGIAGDERRWRSAALAASATRGLAIVAVERSPAATALADAPLSAAAAAAVAGLDHVVVASADLEAGRRLFADALGLRLALDRRFEARGLRILFFRVGGVTIELVGPLAADRPAAPQDRFGGLAWRTPDVAAARVRLLAAGFDVSEVRGGARPGTRVCSVRTGTCGVPTLLIGPDAVPEPPTRLFRRGIER